MAPATHFTPSQAHAAAAASHHPPAAAAAAATATATARLHASAPAPAAATVLCPPFLAAGSHSSAACPPVQNPIFSGPAAPWVVQPQRAAASALGPEFRRARSTKNISKRNNRGPGAQDRGGRASSAAAGRCVDKLLRVAPEDRRALGVSLSSFRGELVSPDDYCHVLRELGDRDKSAPRALEVFHAALPLVGNGSVDKGKLLTAAIGALGKMGRPDLARRAFETGIAGGYGKTVFAYSALISAYARSGLANEAMGVLESMKGAGLRPTTVTYNAVIDACGKGGVDLRFTLGYFRQMLRDGLCPDRKTFNSLLSACSRAGHLEDARAVFDEMIHLGIGRDIYTYNTFIDAICKCGNIELAMQVLLDMEAKKVKPNVVTYSTLIDGYSKLEKYDEALKLYEKMKSLGIKLDRVCYNTVLSIYVKTGKYGEIAIVRCNNFEDAALLLEQLRLLDNFVYGVAHGLLMGHQEIWSQAQSLFSQLGRMDSSTSSAFYNALTDVLWHFGQRQGAQLVVLEGVNRRVWENTWSEFCLDLHLMSCGAAQAMVHAWLLNVRSIVFAGRAMPEFLSILTGWGKHSKIAGASTLRHVIEALLNSIGAPFQVERFNIGRFVSPSAVVAAWLKESGTINILLLNDERAQHHANTSNLVTRLQGLQL
uniref:Uncharacterized protein n=1 Tax=Avena sativa TaxID=4498 RepID=A0ACD5YLY4_AVESA